MEDRARDGAADRIGVSGSARDGAADRIGDGASGRVAAETAARELETAPALDVVGWAIERFGSDVVLACSFEDCVLVDLAVRVNPTIEVLFLDTGFHFPETLAFVETVRSHYDLRIRVLRPNLGPGEWPCGTERCCELRKVEPLAHALEGRRAWMTGLKRCDSPTRAGIPVVGWDEAREMMKVNPLARWSDGDISRYTADNGLPVHPLADRGYLSIGCAPTTRPVLPGEQPRAGRWSGTDKTECGLHT